MLALCRKCVSRWFKPIGSFGFFFLASIRFLSFVDKLMYKSIEIISALRPLPIHIAVAQNLSLELRHTERWTRKKIAAATTKWAEIEIECVSFALDLNNTCLFLAAGCQNGRCKPIQTDIHHTALVSWNLLCFEKWNTENVVQFIISKRPMQSDLIHPFVSEFSSNGLHPITREHFEN